ncbi:hypermethylated in cancer 2 protein-like [Lepisosteus oculatus]|uniref:hypermethylated in cancer 2 protein-like n=1 Tax=Lepisosteus oculatus TaxID=7918 RepID=UPI0037133C13
MACPLPVSSHALTLLRELNSQRQSGQFCDCVIRLQLHPEKLYIAHRSVLAASSPLLASLLPSQGSLLDLGCPTLTPEAMGLLLEFIYTGTLPPLDLKDSVLSAAVYLEMEQLLQALGHRGAALLGSPGRGESAPVKEQASAESEALRTHRKRRLAEYQPVPRDLPSPLLNGKPEQTTPLVPSCEVVPVIRRASTRGKPEKTSSFPGTQTPLPSQIPGSDMLDLGFHCGESKEAGSGDQGITVSRSGNQPKSHGLQYGTGSYGILKQANWPSALSGTAGAEPPCPLSNPTAAESESSKTSSENSVIISRAAALAESTGPHRAAVTECDDPWDFDEAKGDFWGEAAERCAVGLAAQSERAVVHESTPMRPQACEGVSDSRTRSGLGTEKWPLVPEGALGSNTRTATIQPFSALGSRSPAVVVDDGDNVAAEVHNPGRSENETCSFLTVCGAENDPVHQGEYSHTSTASMGVQTGRNELSQGNGNSSNSDVDTRTFVMAGGGKGCGAMEKREDCRGEKCVFFTNTTGEDTGEFPTDIDDAAARAQRGIRNINRNTRDSEEKWEGLNRRENGENALQIYQAQVTYSCIVKENPEAAEMRDSDNVFANTAFERDPAGLCQPKHSVAVLESALGKDTMVNYSCCALPTVAQPYQCSVCERIFSQRGSLNRHMRSHLGVRPYPCPQCPMTFSRQYRVMEHLRVHQRGQEGPESAGSS